MTRGDVDAHTRYKGDAGVWKNKQHEMLDIANTEAKSRKDITKQAKK